LLTLLEKITMGVSERRLRQKQEVRCSILATAWQIVKEDGWQSLSIRKIADAIEYSVPVVYDHFESKEMILIEFARDGFRLLVKKLQLVRNKHTDPAQQFRAIADAYWHFAFKNKEYYQVMFGLGMPCSEEESCLPEKVAFRDVLAESIEAIVAQHRKKEVDTCMKTHIFWSVVHGLISLKMMTKKSDFSDDLNKLVLDDAVEGFIKNLA
jgi:AcrR family transcriptional regulator